MPEPKEQKSNNTIQFRDAEIKEKMRQRCRYYEDDTENISASGMARECLNVYLYLMESTLQNIEFTEAEALLLCDAMNGSLMRGTPLSILVQTLYANVEDFMLLEREDSEGSGLPYIKKWDCDYHALLEKLKAFTPTETLAVCDAVDQFWNWTDSYHVNNNHDQLIKVGLIKKEEPKKIEMKFSFKVDTNEDAQLIFDTIHSSVRQVIAESGIKAAVGFERL